MRYRYYHRIHPNGYSYDVNAGDWRCGPWESTLEAAVNHLRNSWEIGSVLVEREDDEGRSMAISNPSLYLRQDTLNLTPRWEAGQFAGRL